MKNNIYTNGTYIQNNPHYHVEDSCWKSKQIFKMIKKNGLELHSICEIGCGAGEVLRQTQILLGQNISCYGYEISPDAFSLCMTREHPNLKYFNLDLTCQSSLNYDLLMCIDVFEHVEDYFGFLRKLKNKAEYKIFHIPLDISVLSVALDTPFKVNRENYGHLHYFSKTTALSTLKDAGYEILDFFYTPKCLDLGNTLKAKIAKVPITIISLVSEEWAARFIGGYSLLVLAK